MKKILNISFSVLLVLGILSSAFGVYAMVVNPTANDQTEPSNPAIEQNTGDTATVPEYTMPTFDGAPNEAVLKDEVKLFTGTAAAKISSAIETVKTAYSYNNNSFVFTLNGTAQDLLGDLAQGEYFYIDGVKNTTFSGAYILRVDSIYEIEGKTYLKTSQPELDDVFDSIDVSFQDLISKKNLVNSATADGVTAYFGDVEKEITTVSHTENFDTGTTPKPMALANSGKGETPNLTLTATEYSTDPTDLIINFDFDLKKNEEKDKNDKENGNTLSGEVGHDFKLTGKIGLEDLSAYMVCDMPIAGQFNELMFGLRGKKVKQIAFEAGLNGSIKPEATKFTYNGVLIDAEITGLNQKWIPLGIWQFTGNTFITVTQKGFETAKMLPSFFVMLYMDAEGNFDVKFTASYTYESTFNSGLSVVKSGKTNMSVINYPYAVVNGVPVSAGEGKNIWEAKLEATADASITFLGASVQFYFAGINLGEITMMDLGVEAKGELSVAANSADGIITSFDDDSSSLYVRAFIKSLGMRAKVNAEIEAVNRKLSGGADFAFTLVDVTLFEHGAIPSKYQNKTPVSSKWVPNEFDSVVCIVGDVSSSMADPLSTGGTKIEALIEAGHAITNVMENTTNGVQGLAIVKFSSDAQTVAIPHNDYEFIHQCIDTLDTEGGTSISSGLDVGVTQLLDVNATEKTIILMTDGQDGGSFTDVLAQVERAVENNIQIFTIGFGNDVDEETLREIAEKGNGEYRYSAADTMLAIISGFLYTYESSQGEVLLDTESTVAQGDTVTADTFTVPDENGNLHATLSWPGSILDLILVDPNGREVDEDYPNAIINNSSIPATVTVANPLPGTWEFLVKGVETSYDQEPYYAIAAFRQTAQASMAVNPPLSTTTTIGAYCLPIGVFIVIISLSALIVINKKKKADQE